MESLYRVPRHLKKFKFKRDQTTWEHHRSGWKYVLSGLRCLESEESGGMLFDGYLDGHFWFDHRMYEPFVGFFHNAPEHPEHISDKYREIPSLRRLLEKSVWTRSYDLCRGLFVLSDYLAEYLRGATGLTVSVVRHPTEPANAKFDWENFCYNRNKKAFCIGHWMRNFDVFFSVESKIFKKCLLMGGANDEDHEIVRGHLKNNSDVENMDYISNYDYDKTLAENIAFVPMYDASANNVVVECIMRGTPILINRLPAAIEYLGEDYPLFFDSAEEASEKINDLGAIREAAEYLRNKDKTFLSIDYFVKQMINTEVYRNIKVKTVPTIL